MRNCYLCGKNTKKGSILHAFPKCSMHRKAWMKFCNLKYGTDDVKNLKLCSQHFKNEDYLGHPCTNIKKWLLISGAIPSIKRNKALESINTSTTLCPKLNIKGNQKENIQQQCFRELPNDTSVVPTEDEYTSTTEENITEDTPMASTSCSEMNVEENQIECERQRRFYDPRYINEIVPTDLDTPERRKRTLKLIKEKFSNKQRELDILKKRSARFEQKLHKLQDIIKHLQEKGRIEQDTGDGLLGYINTFFK